MQKTTPSSRAQTIFLRAFQEHPAGPPPELWPSPAVFQRWLARPHFRAALQATLAALRFQTDLHLAIAACQTARHLASSPAAPNNPPDASQLLRLHHLRQRFPAAPAAPAPADQEPHDPNDFDEREWVRSINGEEAVKAYDELVEMRRQRRLREQAHLREQAQAHAHPQPSPQDPRPDHPSSGSPQESVHSP